MATIRAIKIDVVAQDVYEINITKGLQGLYGGLGLDCKMIELGMRLSSKSENAVEDSLYIDEEGYIRGDEHIKGGFEFEHERYGRSNIFANNGLIVGLDSEGDSCDATQFLDEIKARVTFYSRRDG